MSAVQNLQLSGLASMLVLVGGIILVVVGIISILVSPIIGVFAGLLEGISHLGQGILQIVIGFIALLGHRRLRSLAWTTIILVLGIIAGGLGGLILIIGALIALVIMFIKT